VFIAFSVGGLISYTFSSRIRLEEMKPPREAPGQTFRKRSSQLFKLVFSHHDFVQFSVKRYIFIFGTLLATPIFPIYYVKEVNANDAWIGLISTAQTAVLVIGYYFWTREHRKRGSRFVLLWTTFVLSLYPALVALTHQVQVIVILAGFSGIFQAGLDLVFFDELMKTVPVEYSPTFVSLSQGLHYSAAVFAPMLGTLLSGMMGLSEVLIISAIIRLVGFIMFTFWNAHPVASSQMPRSAGADE
jgi:Na+/melibiose symporter-like transporter